MKKIMLKLLIGSLCLSAFIGIVIIFLGSFGDIECKILETTSLVFGYSIPGLCSSTIYEKKKLHSFSIIGMLIALISCIYMICLVWEIFNFNFFDSNQWKFIFTINILCLSTGHISLLSLINNKNNMVNNFKVLTIGASVIIDIMILVLIWASFYTFDFYYRILSILGILITLGTILTPSLNKIYKNDSPKNSTI